MRFSVLWLISGPTRRRISPLKLSPGIAPNLRGSARYFLRVGDTCLPVVGDDVLRLASERPSLPWETLTSLGTRRAALDAGKMAKVTAGIRASDRVKASVKEKSDGERRSPQASLSQPSPSWGCR